MANDVYLSSTLNDLLAEREAVLDVLQAQGLGVRQSYVASERDLVTSCLADVAACTIFIGIIGLRYGYCPPGHDGAEGPLSITELEFAEGQRRNLDCFWFVKEERAVSVVDTDLASGENGRGQRIAAFRARLLSGQRVRPERFASVEQLRERVLAAVLRHRQGARPSSIFAADDVHPGELTVDIALVMDGPPQDGDDEALVRAVEGDRRFALVRADPSDPMHLARLDEVCATARAVAWHLSPRALALYRDRPGLLPAALQQQRRRRGAVAALLTGRPAAGTMPPQCSFDALARAEDTLPQALDELHRGLRRQLRSFGLERRVGVPVLVLAMTSDEAAELADPALAWASSDTPERFLRASQLARRVAALRSLPAHAHWPRGSYAAERERWRPFGETQPTAREFVAACIERINGSERSRRDRLFIRTDGLKLEPLWYTLDEHLDPMLGSEAAIHRVRDRGCLVLVDELSLLHPRLRASARVLLRGENVAVVSSQPLDPAPEPVSAQLSADSPLSVGLLLERFRDDRDPRCELALHSPERLERWLHMALPELVATLGGQEAQRRLVARTDELFGAAAAAR